MTLGPRDIYNYVYLNSMVKPTGGGCFIPFIDVEKAKIKQINF